MFARNQYLVRSCSSFKLGAQEQSVFLTRVFIILIFFGIFFLHGRFFQVPIKVNLDKINLVGEVKLSLQLNLVIRHCEVNKASKF